MRSKRGRMAYEAQHYSDGIVFGCTMGNLMHHCRNPVNKRPLMVAVNTLRRVLAPISRALHTCRGSDVGMLVRGMACHRVLQAQGKKLPELKRAPSIDSKTGHIGVVVGASAAILVAFECMSAFEADVVGIGAQLVACLRDAHCALSRWRLPDTYDDDLRAAHSAETRALERARLAVARALEVGGGLSDAAAVRLQLDFYRRAVWPQDEDLSAEAHAIVLERIRSGELVDVERDPLALGTHAPGVTPLAALALPRDGSGSGSESCSGSGSSWGSFSSADSEAKAPAWEAPMFEQLAATLGTQILSADARIAVARPAVISSVPEPALQW